MTYFLKHDDILPTCFFYLKYSGVWQPRKNSASLNTLYRAYTVFVVVGYTLLVIAEVLYIVFAKENRLQIFQENMYLIFTHINAFAKMINIVIKRDKIMLLVDACLAKCWNPLRDEKELQIFTEQNRLTRRITVLFTISVMACIGVYVLIPLFISLKKLPFDAWYPCDVNSSLRYWIFYLHQSIFCILGGSILAASDCAIAGFMLQISAQLSFLSHRLIDFPIKINKIRNAQTSEDLILELETRVIKECIDSHNNILKFAELLSETFIEIVFMQFGITLTVVCTTVYFLAQLRVFSLDFLAVFIYLECLLIQIFYYCWFANEIMLNSENVFRSIFTMDWTILHKQSNKALLTMMIMALTPIELFKGIVIKVNLNAFINIIKVSYSAYNVLQNTL